MTSSPPSKVSHTAEYKPPKLTKVQRGFVERGSIHGDFKMKTVMILQRHGLFALRIDSPNGQWGFMEITALGKRAQAYFLARAALKKAAGE